VSESGETETAKHMQSVGQSAIKPAMQIPSLKWWNLCISCVTQIRWRHDSVGQLVV